MQYLKSYKDRHGKQRHYIRKAGFRAKAICATIGTKEFELQYVEGLEHLDPLPPRKPRPRRQRTMVKVPRWLRGKIGGVYFVKGGERVKIGYSVNIRSRINELQTGSSIRIEFVAAIAGASQDDEKDLHEEFAEYRVHGEWFEYGPRLAQFIALVRTKRAPGLSNSMANHV